GLAAFVLYGKRFQQMLNSLLVVALFRQNAAQAEVCLRKLRTALQCLAQFRSSLQNLPLAFKKVSQIVVSFRVSRIRLHGFTKCFLGFFMFALALKKNSVVEISVGFFRVQPNSRPE